MRDFSSDYTNDGLLAFLLYYRGVPKYIGLLCERFRLSVDGMFVYVVMENSSFIDGKDAVC